jgi:hypothetical protein
VLDDAVEPHHRVLLQLLHQAAAEVLYLGIELVELSQYGSCNKASIRYRTHNGKRVRPRRPSPLRLPRCNRPQPDASRD